jgi:hypothetical protein
VTDSKVQVYNSREFETLLPISRNCDVLTSQMDPMTPLSIFTGATTVVMFSPPSTLTDGTKAILKRHHSLFELS